MSDYARKRRKFVGPTLKWYAERLREMCLLDETCEGCAFADEDGEPCQIGRPCIWEWGGAEDDEG